MQIDKSIYKASGDWMGTKQNIKESRNNTRKSGKQIFNNAEGTYTNVGKKLYCLVNLFDADEDFEIEPTVENVNIDTNLNTNQKGEYIVKYIVVDSDGNTSSLELTIKVKHKINKKEILITTIFVLSTCAILGLGVCVAKLKQRKIK